MRQIAGAFFAFLILSCLHTTGWAGPLGPEFKVNKTTAFRQEHPSIAELVDGGFVIAFDGHDGSSGGVYGQRYDATGKRVGTREFKINKTTAEDQGFTAIAGLAGGGYVIAWGSLLQDGDNYGVYAQRYDAAGKRVGKREFRVNKTIADSQFAPSIAGLADGGFVIFWQSMAQDGSGWGVYGQRYDAAGKRVGAREFKVNKRTTSFQMRPGATSLADGGFAVVWHSNLQDGSGWGVYGQRYDAAGKRVGKREFQVNKYTSSDQYYARIAGLPAGGFVVAWTSDGQDGSGWGVYGQRYDAAGKRVGTREFKVNKTTADGQGLPDIAGLADGGFLISWDSAAAQDGDDYGVFGQRYDSAGKRVGPREFQVNTYTAAGQRFPRVAGLTGGGFVVTWDSEGQDGSLEGVYARMYGP